MQSQLSGYLKLFELKFGRWATGEGAAQARAPDWGFYRERGELYAKLGNLNPFETQVLDVRWRTTAEWPGANGALG